MLLRDDLVWCGIQLLTLTNVSLNVIIKYIQICCHCHLIMPCKIIMPFILFFLAVSPFHFSAVVLSICAFFNYEVRNSWRCETPLSFLEIWAIKINPVILKPSSNGVALPDFSDSRALAAQGFLWPHALQGVTHLILPFQSHRSGMGGISKHPTLADRSVLSYTIT